MSNEVAAAVAEVYRREWARVFASTVKLARDLDIAEECTHDAFVQALQRWPSSGLPNNPGAWLTTTARNRVRDVLRRQAVLERALPLLVVEPAHEPEDPLVDDRLRLIFTCCHPALSRDAQIALTLRLVCGLSTAEVARAFLVTESTMAARVTRAKHKIAKARLPYRVPSPDKFAERSACTTAARPAVQSQHRPRTWPVGRPDQRYVQSSARDELRGRGRSHRGDSQARVTDKALVVPSRSLSEGRGPNRARLGARRTPVAIRRRRAI